MMSIYKAESSFLMTTSNCSRTEVELKYDYLSFCRFFLNLRYEKKKLWFFPGKPKGKMKKCNDYYARKPSSFSSLYSTKCIKKCTLQFIIENFVYAKKKLKFANTKNLLNVNFAG